MGKFEEINNYEELVSRLKELGPLKGESGNGKDEKYVSHYTSLESVVKIFEKKYWHLSSPSKMNDGLELDSIGSDYSGKLFFSSFMYEVKESIAMWSMYSQPWKRGVMIRIPVKEFKKWCRDSPDVYPVDHDTKNIDFSSGKLNSVDIFAHRVAYTEIISGKSGSSRNGLIYCGGQTNDKLPEAVSRDFLKGYIKDNAWSYENEVRLRVESKNYLSCEAVAVKVPEYIFDSMQIVAGPRFDGDLYEEIKEQIKTDFNIGNAVKSKFFEKLKKTYCDTCQVNK